MLRNAGLILLMAATVAVLPAQTPKPAGAPKNAKADPSEKALFAAILADSMRGDVSFLASDALEGRDTPSRGLEVAAEYIAAQFRALGLKPAGGEGYFQLADYAVGQPKMDGFALKVQGGGEDVSVASEQVMLAAMKGGEANGADVVVVDPTAPVPERSAVEGKVVWMKGAARMTTALAAKRDQIRAMGALLVMYPASFIARRVQLREAGGEADTLAPTVAVQNAAFAKAVEAPGAKVSFKIAPAAEERVKLKNVLAVLEGSDPQLKSTYIIVSGHYDHTGVSPRGDGDRIFNGANDDASGTSVVLELARAFVRTGLKPKRSIVFALWFGEEKGLLGSKFYAKNPPFPLKQTVAMLNFEHMGRTDDTEGSTKGRMSMTGFDYTGIGAVMKDAGAAAGIEVFKHEKNSDAFFARSDNQAFADAGVPAHAVLGCYIFPDYHRVGDHWDKIDYDNMAQLTRASAAGVWRMANSANAPQWVETNPRTASYVTAAKALYGAN